MFLFVLMLAMQTAPVDLQSCRVPMAMPIMPDKPAPAQPLAAGVAVTFVNRASQAATQVTLRVSYANRTELMTDAGNFSPGVQIKTMFPNFAGANYWRDEPDACSIVRVKFADGSIWAHKASG
ncbi:MAG TPA: hypothetical protein VGG22_00310 [Candidatus Baltobacteraceae bacterium]